jgi:hypothetical protein
MIKKSTYIGRLRLTFLEEATSPVSGPVEQLTALAVQQSYWPVLLSMVTGRTVQSASEILCMCKTFSALCFVSSRYSRSYGMSCFILVGYMKISN